VSVAVLPGCAKISAFFSVDKYILKELFICYTIFKPQHRVKLQQLKINWAQK
jgi:hypothetical protein